MTNKPKEKEPRREPGPKFVIPENFRIRRASPSPMADILREAEAASRTIHDSPTVDDSPTATDSPTKPEPVALPQGSPTVRDSPTASEQPKRRTRAEYRAGDSRTNHDLFDAELCPLPPLSQLLWFHLNRYRDHGSELTVVLSWKRLGERFGDGQMHVNSMRRAFAPLERAGLAFKERTVYGKGGEQGIIFRLYTHGSPTADGSPTTGSSNKRTALKDKELKGIDIKACPDCSGTGFWYPEGPEHGVDKCRHPKLVNQGS